MGENVTLDRIDFEKLQDQAKAERAECLRQYGMAAMGLVRSRLRARRVIAVAAVLLFSFGVKMLFWSARTAEANIRVIPSARMNILQMHIDHPNRSNLPAQQMHDMTFVWP